MSALSLAPSAAWLKLDSQGFTVRYWFKDDTYRYMGFIPVRRSVGFKFSESYPKRNAVSRIAGAIASFDRNLPDNYGMKALDLAALLESCRRQAVGVDAKPLSGSLAGHRAGIRPTVARPRKSLSSNPSNSLGRVVELNRNSAS